MSESDDEIDPSLEDVAGVGDSEKSLNFDYESVPHPTFTELPYLMSGGVVVMGSVIESMPDADNGGQVLHVPGLVFKFRNPFGGDEFFEPDIALVGGLEMLDKFISDCSKAVRGMRNHMKAEGWL